MRVVLFFVLFVVFVAEEVAGLDVPLPVPVANIGWPAIIIDSSSAAIRPGCVCRAILVFALPKRPVLQPYNEHAVFRGASRIPRIHASRQ